MKVFDSIAHPTINGKWFGTESHNTFENLVAAYQSTDIAGGCAISLPFIDINQLTEFYERCKKQPVPLYPVAAINFDEPDLEEKVLAIKRIGYSAVKIHPRISGLNFDTDYAKLEQVFKLCEKYEMIIFFCTYYHTTIKNSPLHPLSYYLISLLKSAPEVNIILLHGGDVNLMQLVQLARFNSNILIDLSYTFLKFSGSSIETDILFLMKNFDRKICFGSDYPEYSIQAFVDKLKALSKNVPEKEKVDNYSYKNIMNFLRLK